MAVNVKRALKRSVNQMLRPVGFRLERIAADPVPPAPDEAGRDPRLGQQEAAEAVIVRAHVGHTLEDHARLTQRYATPVFGTISPWDLVMMLGQCVDPTDRLLGTASQLTHVLQILDAMRADGVDDEDLLLAAVVHDLGKLLLLTDEAPEHIVCMNQVLAVGDRTDPSTVVPQWNHDELVHMRLAPYVSEEMAVVLRCHSVMPADLEARLDGERCAGFLRRHRQFFDYDQGSKSPLVRPHTTLAEVRALVERRLPATIEF